MIGSMPPVDSRIQVVTLSSFERWSSVCFSFFQCSAKFVFTVGNRIDWPLPSVRVTHG